jgi:hypothetical protein
LSHWLIVDRRYIAQSWPAQCQERHGHPAVLGSGKVSFDAERSNRVGHAGRFWAVVLACQKERALRRARPAVIGVRIIG